METQEARGWRSILPTFTWSDKSPEGALLSSMYATAALLLAAALFVHSPLPAFPAAILLFGLHTYHTRRTADKP